MTSCTSYCLELCDGSCAAPVGDSLEAWQAALGAWTLRTFGGSRPRETLVHRRGFSLAEALARKHAVNLGRTWREGEDGMIRHV